MSAGTSRGVLRARRNPHPRAQEIDELNCTQR